MVWPAQYEPLEDSEFVFLIMLPLPEYALLLGMTFRNVRQYVSTGQSEWDQMPGHQQPVPATQYTWPVYPSNPAGAKLLMIMWAPSQEPVFLTGCLKRQFMNVQW